MEELVSTATLQCLLGIGKPALSDLAARGIVKRGTYLVEESVSGYCAHLRDMAVGRAVKPERRQGKGWLADKRRSARLRRADSR